MTWWEYAIARCFAQMLAESEARTLTEKETERLEVLAKCVERYEAREVREANEKANRRKAQKRTAAAAKAQVEGEGLGATMATGRTAERRKSVVDDFRAKEPRPADQAQV